MPTFCRHNRFIERCPICAKELDEQASPGRTGGTRTAGARTRTARGSASAPVRTGTVGLRVRRETRAADDGYRSELAPGLRASADAYRLAEEIAFASGRLLALAADPPGIYALARGSAPGDPERGMWICVLTAYLCPLEGDDPFAGIRLAVERSPVSGAPTTAAELPSLEGVPLGPRTSHDPVRGEETLRGYLQWVARGGTATAGGAGPASQGAAFVGDPGWTPQRRFERVFERLSIPGLGRAGRYELLLLRGRLGLCELTPDALHLIDSDATTLAAKRVFGIGDAILLERRSLTLAEAIGVPLEALDLALFNWTAATRATLGFPPDLVDEGALERGGAALGC
jgi:hypothetical protein